MARQQFWKHQHKDPPAMDKTQERTTVTHSSATQRTTSSATEQPEQGKFSQVIGIGNYSLFTGAELHVHIEQPGRDDIQNIPTDDNSAPKATPNRPGSEKRNDKDKTNWCWWISMPWMNRWYILLTQILMYPPHFALPISIHIFVVFLLCKFVFIIYFSYMLILWKINFVQIRLFYKMFLWNFVIVWSEL